MAEVRLTSIRKTFAAAGAAEFQALKGVDLAVASGESFTLLGPSGCGKTTLLRIIAGLEFADEGKVEMAGRDVTRLPPEQRPTAMVFQNYALFPHLTVEGNVSFGLKLRGLAKEEIARKIGAALELVQLSGLGARRIDELSGGQQQRVALARVLAIEPKILLMDEPLSNLDASLRRTTRSAIRRIQSELGLTLIYVTHDQEEGLMISDRLALMREGRILQTGTPQELYESPASFEVARFLGQRNMIPAVVKRLGEDCVVLALEGRPEAGEARIAVNRTELKCRPGDKVWLAVRPDEIELDEAGFTGKIAMVSFAGSSLEIEAKIDGLEEMARAELRLDADSGEAARLPRRGDAVRIGVKRGGGLLFSREG